MLALMVAGCGESGPGEFEEGDLIGTWVLTTTERTSCAGAFDGVIRMTIAAADIRELEGRLVVLGSAHWVFEGNGQWNGQVTGAVEAGSGAVSLNVWRRTLESGAKLDGIMTSDNTFTGTLDDPISGQYDPIFSLGCTFDVSGTRE